MACSASSKVLRGSVVARHTTALKSGRSPARVPAGARYGRPGAWPARRPSACRADCSVAVGRHPGWRQADVGALRVHSAAGQRHRRHRQLAGDGDMPLLGASPAPSGRSALGSSASSGATGAMPRVCLTAGPLLLRGAHLGQQGLAVVVTAQGEVFPPSASAASASPASARRRRKSKPAGSVAVRSDSTGRCRCGARNAACIIQISRMSVASLPRRRYRRCGRRRLRRWPGPSRARAARLRRATGSSAPVLRATAGRPA